MGWTQMNLWPLTFLHVHLHAQLTCSFILVPNLLGALCTSQLSISSMSQKPSLELWEFWCQQTLQFNDCWLGLDFQCRHKFLFVIMATKIHPIMGECIPFPVLMLISYNSSTPWLSKSILHLIQKRNWLYKWRKKPPSPMMKYKYSVVKCLWHTKQLYHPKHFHEPKEILEAL